MFALLGEGQVWELMFNKVAGALPFAAFAGFLWNLVRRGGLRGLVIRALASMAIIVVGWWALLFGVLGIFFAVLMIRVVQPMLPHSFNGADAGRAIAA
jgi:hypothetical protein